MDNYGYKAVMNYTQNLKRPAEDLENSRTAGLFAQKAEVKRYNQQVLAPVAGQRTVLGSLPGKTAQANAAVVDTSEKAKLKPQQWTEQPAARPAPVLLAPAPQPRPVPEMIPENVDDIDARDFSDPQQCVPLVTEIFNYLFEHEKTTRPNEQYLETVQTDLTPHMRSVVVDFVVKSCVRMQLTAETQFLAVNLIDRFLSLKNVTRHRLILVAAGALLIASKYEEPGAPPISDIVLVTGYAITKEETLRIEKIMLQTLDFDLSHASPLIFLRRFSKAANSSPRIHTLCKFLIDLSMTDYSFLRYLPSLIAASAVYLARVMTANERPYEQVWNSTLRYYTRYDQSDVYECARELNRLVLSNPVEKSPINTIKQKYSSPNLFNVALIRPVQF